MILSSVRHLFQKFTPTSACGRVPIRSLRTLVCMQLMSINTLMGTMVLVNNKCSGIRLFCSVCIAVCEQHGGQCSSSMRWTSVAVTVVIEFEVVWPFDLPSMLWGGHVVITTLPQIIWLSRDLRHSHLSCCARWAVCYLPVLSNMMSRWPHD